MGIFFWHNKGRWTYKYSVRIYELKGKRKMNNKSIGRLYWVFWVLTVVFTGILAGFMLSHSIMLGRFFSWAVSSGNEAFFHQTFAVFREATKAYIVYDIPLYLSLVCGVVFIVPALVLKRDRVMSVIGGLSTFWTGSIFFAAELNEVEDAVVTGTATPDVSQYFLSINVPLHSCFAVIYTVCLVLLLIVGLRQRRREGAGV
jgi:hypothetical protein